MDRAPPPAPEPVPLLAAWPPSTQLATAFLLGAAAILLGLQIWQASGHGSRPAELHRALRPIDLNRASRAELLQLPGVGPVLAERIEMERDSQGGFRSVDDLRQVPGIGPATLERLRPWIVVDGGPERTPAAFATVPPVQKAEFAAALDINRASAEELQRLPGIGKVLSQRIIAGRPYQTVEELDRVPGIGPKTIERLRPHVMVGDSRE